MCSWGMALMAPGFLEGGTGKRITLGWIGLLPHPAELGVLMGKPGS